MARASLLLVICLCSMLVTSTKAEQCGTQAGGALCPGGLCCSQWGWCGSTSAYCGQGCQSQCTGGSTTSPPPPSPPPPPPPSSSSGQCGAQAGGALCAGGLCCSQWGWCGSTSNYCGQGCQSQCSGGSTPPPPPPSTPSPPPPTSSSGVGSIVTQVLFDQMLLHRNDAACPAKNFYTYSAFITAASYFPAFGTTGDLATRQKEVAAFFGQTSHETTGGWPTAPDGPYAWGYCFIVEQGNPGTYCTPSTQWPCAAGKSYYGRGPIQLTHNYNYGPAGQAIGAALLSNPDLVATDAVISFKAALWFWMTPQAPKPSSHDVIIGAWTPSAADITAGRLPGYGVITNIVNGAIECGHGADSRVADRIGYYKRYCDMFGVGYGSNLDCYNQTPFGS